MYSDVIPQIMLYIANIISHVWLIHSTAGNVSVIPFRYWYCTPWYQIYVYADMIPHIISYISCCYTPCFCHIFFLYYTPWYKFCCICLFLKVYITGCSDYNSLGPSDTIWWYRSGSTLAQVMACCLTAPSHYLNQCWLIISKVQWHLSEGIFVRDTSATIH